MDRLLEHVPDAVDEALLLALGEQRACADGSEEAADAGAAGPDRLGERPLRDERRVDLAGVDRRDRLRVGVKYDEMPRRIRPCRSSFPRPRPGSPMLFETIVRSVASECSTSASMSASGAPTSPNPPTMTVSPERTTRTASSGEIRVLALTSRRVTKGRRYVRCRRFVDGVLLCRTTSWSRCAPRGSARRSRSSAVSRSSPRSPPGGS